VDVAGLCICTLYLQYILIPNQGTREGESREGVLFLLENFFLLWKIYFLYQQIRLGVGMWLLLRELWLHLPTIKARKCSSGKQQKTKICQGAP